MPEISLTPQMIEAFSAYFGDTVAVLHSGLPLSERYDEWKRIRAGLARVVVGIAQRGFAPVQDLGLLIIDEEQEDTYKSESTPRYHARRRGQVPLRPAPCAAAARLGNAGRCQPLLRRDRRYHYFTLPDRFNARKKLPDVIIADMKQELRNGNSGSISSVLYGELEENLRRGEQSILFLNRRGASKIVTCAECGATYSCPNCSVSLTYHQATKCSSATTAATAGGRSAVPGLRRRAALSRRRDGAHRGGSPRAVPRRGDAAHGCRRIAMAGTHEALLQRFARERIPIMIGTQMITKG